MKFKKRMRQSKYISKDELKIFEAIQNIIGEKPNLELNLKLYKQAVIHGNKIVQKKIQNLTDDQDFRTRLFPSARRYTEICFITKPSDNYIELITKILENKYKIRILSGINQAGIALFPLKSTRCIVVIFMAFLKPNINEQKIDNFFSKLPPGNLFSYNDLINIINSYRDFIEFPKLEPKTLNLSLDSIVIKRITSVSSIRKLLKKWLQDPILMDFLNELWTSFAIQIKKINEKTLTYSFGFVGHGISSQVVLTINVIEDKDELNLSPFTFTPRTPSMEQDSSMTQIIKTFSLFNKDFQLLCFRKKDD